MIYDQLKNAHLYAGVGTHAAAALRFLETADFSGLSDGRHEIDGTDVYAMVMAYETHLPEAANPEAHDRYIDVQYMIDGEEMCQVGFRDEMETIVEQRTESDISFFTGPTQPVLLGRGRFLMLFPQDVHASGIVIGEPKTVRKAVVKVKVQDSSLR